MGNVLPAISILVFAVYFLFIGIEYAIDEDMFQYSRGESWGWN